jgi:ABC-type uncharacterized transport system involved in gliding motility auxiliary subunit
MKLLKPRFKFLKYMFWLSPMLIIMGLSAGLVANSWGAVPIGLIGAGLLLGVLWMIMLGRGEEALRPNFWQRRSTQASTNALVSTIAVVVILGLLNFLSVRYLQRIDLTEARLFTLAPETQQILQQLNQGVKAIVFDGQPNPKDVELLQNYQRQGRKFSFEFIDPEANPGIAQQFDIKNTPNSRDVYLELQNSQRRQFVQSVSPNVRLSEIQLTNKILQLTTDGGAKAYFVQGHGEKSLMPGDGSVSISLAIKALEVKNFSTVPLNLIQQNRVPADAAVVLVVGPTRNLTDAEVKALSAYLDQGGNVLVAVDPEVKSGLDPLLSAWGVKLDDRVAINAPKQQVANIGPALVVVNQYGQHPITKDFNGFSFYPLARPIDITPVSGVQTTPLLLTDPESWAESNLKEKPLKLSEGDRPGPLTIGVALTRPLVASSPSSSPSPTASASPTASSTPSPSPIASPSPKVLTAAPKESRLIVFGNAAFIADNYLPQQLNGDVFLNSVTWLSQQGDRPLSIRPKEIKNRRVILTLEQQLTLFILAVVLVPLLGFIGAGVVWWRRR